MSNGSERRRAEESASHGEIAPSLEIVNATKLTEANSVIHSAHEQVKSNVTKAARAAGVVIKREDPSVVVVSDEEFIRFINSAIESTEGFQPEFKERPMPAAAYVDGLQTTFLPQRTAEMFGASGAVAIAARSVLTEEYLHHVTAALDSEGRVIRVGFYSPEQPRVIQDLGLESGETYNAKLVVTKTGSAFMPEAAADPHVTLTENATTVLTSLLALSNEPELSTNKLVILTRRRGEEIEQVLFTGAQIRLVQGQLTRALFAGNPSLLNFEVTNVIGNPANFNMREWLSYPDVKVLLARPRQYATGQMDLDIFCYEDLSMYGQGN